MKHIPRWIVVVTIVVLGIFYLQQKPTAISMPREEIWPIMGTVASLRTPADARQAFPAMLQIAKDTFADVNAKLSVYDPASEISRLNNQGYLDPVSDLTREFLITTKTMTARTDGRFDPSLLPVIQLWGFSGGTPPNPLPSQTEISQALRQSGLAHLIIEPESVRYPDRISHIDPGGIAKGFALDRAFDAIRAVAPDAAFLLNLGGEIRVHGQAESNRPWRIGIQHPFEKGVSIGAVIVPSGRAIATSGHYERYFERDGTRYAHIIDPKSGWPVTGMAGVTVLCPNATDADVLSTSLFVAGPDAAHALLLAFPESYAILIPDRQPLEIFVSEGLQKWFEPAPAYRHLVKTLPSAAK